MLMEAGEFQTSRLAASFFFSPSPFSFFPHRLPGAGAADRLVVRANAFEVRGAHTRRIEFREVH